METIIFFIIVAIAFGKAWEVTQGDFKSKGFAIEFAKVALWYAFIAVAVYFGVEVVQIYFIQEIAQTGIQAEIILRQHHRVVEKLSEEITFLVMIFEGLRQLLLFVAKHGIRYYIEKQKGAK